MRRLVSDKKLKVLDQLTVDDETLIIGTDTQIDGAIVDSTGSTGTNGQVLSSTGDELKWIDGSSGGSYTFTNGLTESVGTVSWDLNDRIQVGAGTLAVKMGWGQATGQLSLAVGSQTKAQGYASMAEGYGATASGNYSHAEGYWTTASNGYAHAEGQSCTASGQAAHAEGSECEAIGIASHAEGAQCKILYLGCEGAHAEGAETEVGGLHGHAQNRGTKVSCLDATALGRWNIDDNTGSSLQLGTYAVMVGNGTSANARSNALTVDWSGNVVAAGKMTVGTTPTADMDVATKKYVDDHSGGTYSAGSGISISGSTISADYTAVQGKLNALSGGGISITNNTITVDTTVIQPKLTAGTGITIDSNNEISATGGSSISAGYGIFIDTTSGQEINVEVDDGLTIDNNNCVVVNYGTGLTLDGSQLVVDTDTIATKDDLDDKQDLIETVSGGLSLTGKTLTVDATHIIPTTGAFNNKMDQVAAGSGISLTSSTIAVDFTVVQQKPDTSSLADGNYVLRLNKTGQTLVYEWVAMS